jgi:hypothetical protein
MIHSSVLTNLAIRITSLSTLPHQRSPLIPFNSHPCATSRSNSPEITSLRKNSPGVVSLSRFGTQHASCTSSRNPLGFNNLHTPKKWRSTIQTKQSACALFAKTWGVYPFASQNGVPRFCLQEFSSDEKPAPPTAARAFPMYNGATSGRHDPQQRREIWQRHPKPGNPHPSASSAP